jgi:hypothetical protein
MGTNMKMKIFIITGIILFLAIAYIRFHHLEADPDTSINWSSDFYTDEGWFNGDAMNRILTGSWLCQRHNAICIMPLAPIMAFVLFKIFGISLFWARFPVAFLSLIAIAVSVYLINKDKKNIPLTLLDLFLLGTSYYLFIYSRVALMEMAMIGMGLAGLCLYLESCSSNAGPKKILYGISSGLLIAMAMLIKSHAVIFIMAIALHGIIERLLKRKPASLLPIITSFFVFALSIGITFSVFGVQKCLSGVRADFGLIGRFSHFGGEGINIFQTIGLRYMQFFRNQLVSFDRPLILIAMLSAFLSLITLIKDRTISVIENAMLCLAVSAYVFTCFFEYQPPRYFLIFLIPAAYFASILPLGLYRHHKGKAVFGLAIALVITANIPNCIDLVRYSLHHHFTAVETARRIKTDILKDTKKPVSDIILCGELSSAFSLTNNLKFSYSIGPESEYIAASGPGFFHGGIDVMPLGEYDYMKARIRLYKRKTGGGNG